MCHNQVHNNQYELRSNSSHVHTQGVCDEDNKKRQKVEPLKLTKKKRNLQEKDILMKEY